MDINYYKKYEPIFGTWYIKSRIGAGGYGQVFLIEHEEFGKKYQAALKTMSIPNTQDEIKILLSEGMNLDQVKAYYRNIVKEIVRECEVMSQLKGITNIVSYEDHMCVPHENGIGYDILIRMELLTPLHRCTINKVLPQNEVIKIGIDICKALEVCEKKGIIHRDIKPENIFLSSNGDYKLGDFGIARSIEETIGILSKKGTPQYMAPEVYKGEMYGSSVDIYSLGIVLYKLLNNNRGPLLPPVTEDFTHDIKRTAVEKRVHGEPIPPVSNVSSALNNTILKACSYKVEDRYKSPTDFRRSLEYVEGHPDEDDNITEYISEDFKKDSTDDSKGKIPQKRNKIRNVIIVVVIIAALICVLGIVVKKNNNVSSEHDSLIDESVSTTYDIHPNATEYNGHYYEIVNDGMDWGKAKAECENKGGHLVIITDRDEEGFIEQLIETERSNDIYHYWLGATDEEEEGVWKWINGEVFWEGGCASEGGSPIDGMYNNWLASQPNNSLKESSNGQDYLEIQVTKGNEGDLEYMTWTDITYDGVWSNYEEYPDYNDTMYYGYICEWDE